MEDLSSTELLRLQCIAEMHAWIHINAHNDHLQSEDSANWAVITVRVRDLQCETNKKQLISKRTSYDDGT
jgi:hypothetical protein